MKSIGVRILAGFITFLIGWSCAKLNFFLFSRPSNVDQSKAEKIFDDDSKVEYVEVVSRPDSESSMPVFSWDGYVRRGKVDVRTGGSTRVVNSVLVSHTEEIYESSDAAAYVLSQFKGQWYSSSDVAPSSSFCKFKVLHRKDNVRIAWVSGSDLHYLESSSYSALTALLQSWGDFSCK
jgi:hypothetical protein